jgi:hypothetical protein
MSLRIYGEDVLALRPSSKLEDHHLSAVCHCLFGVFAATLHIGDRSPIRTAQWWQGPNYHGKRAEGIISNKKHSIFIARLLAVERTTSTLRSDQESLPFSSADGAVWCSNALYDCCTSLRSFAWFVLYWRHRRKKVTELRHLFRLLGCLYDAIKTNRHFLQKLQV